MITLDEFLGAIESRKAALGMIDSADQTEAMRNKGAGRTPEKRELLRRAAERARMAGREPIKAYF